jgi:EAL domain-containing protein (putative c-di-GMP-specific phosphodiesterase class I)
MSDRKGCEGCKNADASQFTIPFTMAFQPIVDLGAQRIWGYESLVRGVNGESAFQVLGQVTPENRYAFDQACRVKSIELAGEGMPAGSDAMLSINFLPNAVYEPRACIRATLAASTRVNFAPHRLMFEFTEQEEMRDTDHVLHILTEYRKMGFKTAIDDFGAGFAGLGLLARFQTDIVKLDMELVRDIDQSPSRQAIVEGVMTMSRLLKFKVLAEGVETEAEALTLRTAGVDLFQGYFFARPQVETFVTEADIAALADGFSHSGYAPACRAEVA